MDDLTPQVTKTLNARQEPITVVVNLTLPPWPTPPAPIPDPPAPPIVIQAPVPPPPAPEPPAAAAPTPVSKHSWVNRWLGVVFLQLADDAKWFYKQVHFWLFAVISCAPDLYNAAVDNHILPGGHVPAPLEKFFNIIGFLGAASIVVKAKQRSQSNN